MAGAFFWLIPARSKCPSLTFANRHAPANQRHLKSRDLYVWAKVHWRQRTSSHWLLQAPHQTGGDPNSKRKSLQEQCCSQQWWKLQNILKHHMDRAVLSVMNLTCPPCTLESNSEVHFGSSVIQRLLPTDSFHAANLFWRQRHSLQPCGAR